MQLGIAVFQYKFSYKKATSWIWTVSHNLPDPGLSGLFAFILTPTIILSQHSSQRNPFKTQVITCHFSAQNSAKASFLDQNKSKSPFHNVQDPVWSGPSHIPKAPILLHSLPHLLCRSCTDLLVVSQIVQAHSRLGAFAPGAPSSPRCPYGQCSYPLNFAQMPPLQ